MNQQANPDRQGGGGDAKDVNVVGTANPVAGAPASPKRALRPQFVALIIGLTLAVAGFALWYFVLRGPANDLEALQGDWQVTIAGRETPNVIHVEGDRWQAVANGIPARAYRVTLNEAANPKEIDLDPADDAQYVGPKPKLYGIYAIDGNTARVRLSDTTQPRPTNFDDPDAVVLTLTKVELEPPTARGK